MSRFEPSTFTSPVKPLKPLCHDTPRMPWMGNYQVDLVWWKCFFLACYVSGGSLDWVRICENSSKVITFIDLAGHEKYLKTTVFGMTGHAPDFGMLMVRNAIFCSNLLHTWREGWVLGRGEKWFVSIIIVCRCGRTSDKKCSLKSMALQMHSYSKYGR